MQHTRFIILNGPPGSGKTTIGRELASYIRDRHHVSIVSDSFAAPMKHFIAVALGQSYLEMSKDSPRAEISGFSVREFLIDLSENYIKERYGEGAFGRWFYHRVGRLNPAPAFVISDDCGFEPEYDAVSGGDRKRVILIRVTREGKTFSGDSRNYLPVEPNYVFDNNGDMADLWLRTRELADAIVAGRV